MSLPPDLAAFITDTIDSVAELEALLLMQREREQPWTVRRLAERLYIDEAAAARVVETLARKQLVAVDGDEYRLEPRSNEDRERIAGLSALYVRMLIPITRLIHEKPRTGIRDFADAFRLREKKP
jgi:hypothetical protein